MAKTKSPAVTQTSNEEEGIDKNLLPYQPSYPTIDSSDDEIGETEYGYSIFNKETDFVIGGPLGEGTWESWKAGNFGKQRWFADWDDALEWAAGFYGKRLKGRKPSEPGDTHKWAVIVRRAS